MSRNKRNGRVCGHQSNVKGAPALLRLIESLEPVSNIKNGRIERHVSERRGVEISRTPHHIHVVLRSDDGIQFFDITPRNGSKICELENEVKHILSRKFAILGKEEVKKKDMAKIITETDHFYSDVYRVLRRSARTGKDGALIVENIRQTLSDELGLKRSDLNRAQVNKKMLTPIGKNAKGKMMYILSKYEEEGVVMSTAAKEETASETQEIEQENTMLAVDASVPVDEATPSSGNGTDMETLRPLLGITGLDPELIAQALEALYEKNDQSLCKLRVQRQNAEGELETLRYQLHQKETEITEIDGHLHRFEETNTKILDILENLR